MHGKDVFKSKTFNYGFLGVNLVDVEKSMLSTKLADKTKQNWLVKNSQEESNHTGTFDSRIISFLTFAPLGSSRVSKEAKNFKEFKFLGLSRCFSVIIASSLKNFASFDTLLDPKGAKVKQISQFLHFVLKFDNSGALYNFLPFPQNKA